MGPARDDLSFHREISRRRRRSSCPPGRGTTSPTPATAPLRLYSVYGPAEHAHGTVHVTKAEADAAEHDH